MKRKRIETIKLGIAFVSLLFCVCCMESKPTIIPAIGSMVSVIYLAIVWTRLDNIEESIKRRNGVRYDRIN